MFGHEDRDWQDVEPDEAGFLKMPRERFRLHTQEWALPATVRAARHPDPRGDLIYRQITWGQCMQADGRIRPVYRKKDSPCVLFILGEVPRGVKVDAVLHWDDVQPDRFDLAVAKAASMGGVVPCSMGALAKFAPELWKNPKAVEKDCRV